MNASYLSEKFAAALPYDRYVLTGTEEQQRRWKQVYDACRLTDDQRRLVGGFVRRDEGAGRQRHLVRRLRAAVPAFTADRRGASRVRSICGLSTATSIAIWPSRCGSTPAIACRWRCSWPRISSFVPRTAIAHCIATGAWPSSCLVRHARSRIGSAGRRRAGGDGCGLGRRIRADPPDAPPQRPAEAEACGLTVAWPAYAAEP